MSEANKNCLTSYNYQTASNTNKVNTPNKRARRELLNAARIKKIRQVNQKLWLAKDTVLGLGLDLG